MTRILLVVVCIPLLLIGSFADVEHESHGGGHHHHHAHDGHDHHDHASHKILLTEEDLEGKLEEQQGRLRIIAQKIDVDKDGLISREEMRDYIEERIHNQHNREADDFINTLDPKGTKKITWDAYLHDNFGDMDIQSLEKPAIADPSMRETRRMYLVDKEKWAYLDQDNDQSLTYDEFRKFLRPENEEGLVKIEIQSIINEYDENKDGKISSDEYFIMTEAESGQGDVLTNELDKSDDGFGDYDELTRYYLPSTPIVVEEETDHLLKECDTNKDGSCTPDEIANAFSSFSGSQITDFGADLLPSKDEL